MTIFGLTYEEMHLIKLWLEKTKVKKNHYVSTGQELYVYHDCSIPKLRHIWLKSGGLVPVTEAETTFLKPAQEFI